MCFNVFHIFLFSSVFHFVFIVFHCFFFVFEQFHKTKNTRAKTKKAPATKKKEKTNRKIKQLREEKKKKGKKKQETWEKTKEKKGKTKDLITKWLFEWRRNTKGPYHCGGVSVGDAASVRWLALRNFARISDVPLRTFPFTETWQFKFVACSGSRIRRGWLMIIPLCRTLCQWKVKRKRKDRIEYQNDRSWPYHGMNACAMKTRTSVLNRFWRDHASDKDGLRGDMSPYPRRPVAAVPKTTFSFAMTVMDKVEGWNEEKWDRTWLRACGFTPKPYYVMAQAWPVSGLPTKTWNHCGKCKLGDWRLSVEHEWMTETKVTMKENLILTCPAHSSGIAVVLSTGKPQSQVLGQWKNNQFRDTENSAIELTCNLASMVLSYPKGVFFYGRWPFSFATHIIKTGIWKKKRRGGAQGKIYSQHFPLYVKRWTRNDWCVTSLAVPKKLGILTWVTPTLLVCLNSPCASALFLLCVTRRMCSIVDPWAPQRVCLADPGRHQGKGSRRCFGNLLREM